MKHQLFLLISTLFIFSACGRNIKSDAPDTSYKIKDHFHLDWAQNSLWNDGKAEVATYSAERIIYGKIRSFDYTYILVKETFNKEFNVKTDNYERNDLFEVMKMNQICRIPTKKYPYHFLTSCFFKRYDAFRLHKLSSSSQEWCGNTYKQVDDHGKDYHLKYHSYWDGESSGKKILDGGVWYEDQLFFTLRTLKFKEGLEFQYPVVESQKSSKVLPIKVYNANVRVKSAKAAELDSSVLNKQDFWKVELQLEEGKTNSYYYSKEYPNELLQFESWDGRKMHLKNLERDAYWEHE